jgi:hypothetical protein
LAGDVVIKVSHGTLTVTGDAAGNNIEVDQTAAGFKITGKNGENFKIKGQADTAGPVDVPGVKDLKFNLKGGEDSVTLKGLGKTVALARNINVNLGAGPDHLYIGHGKLSGKVTVEAGQGDAVADKDQLELESLDIAKDVGVTSGKGNDVILLDDDAIGRNLTINAGQATGATDTVQINGVGVAGNAKLTTTDGNDNIFLTGLSAKKATVNTGGGNDAIFVNVVFLDQALIQLGKGDDMFEFDGPLTLNGPKKSKINGGTELNDTLTGTGKLVANSIPFFVESGFENVVV